LHVAKSDEAGTDIRRSWTRANCREQSCDAQAAPNDQCGAIGNGTALADSIERKAQLDRDLPIRDLPTLDVATRVSHAEPAQIVDSLAGLLYGDPNRRVGARG
jgi:hypothetical protein